MPTTYAHWRFGCDCIDTLPEPLQNIIRSNREIFDLGVHGPDVFFYDLAHKDVARHGNEMHHESADVFFEHCVDVYCRSEKDRDAMLSYILGFLSHYTLDSQCHAYINTKSKVSGISHNKVESEYDGHMMRLDGRAVNDLDRAESLRPNAHIAAVMAEFFPFSGKDLLRTAKMQRFIIGALNCSSDLKRSGLGKILHRMGKDDYADLIVQKDEMEICRDSNLRIDKLRENALKIYPQLAASLMKRIEDGTPLCDYFSRDFDPEANDDIPVLSYQDELNYQPEFH